MRMVTSKSIFKLGLKIESEEQKGENKLGSSLETPDGKYQKMKSLELFNEAVRVDTGNKTALRKLADMEFAEENFLKAAACFE